jgi:hypothetical protein
MQSVTPLTCDARTGGVMNCSLDNFQKAPGLPGAFTSSPIPGVSAASNFACGPTTSSANCLSLLDRIDGGEIVENVQTAPHTDGRDLAGTLNSTIDLGGAETPGMPTGFISFILDPGTGGATIDQLVEQTVSLGDGSEMSFAIQNRTVGYNNPIDGLLVPFSSPDTFTFVPPPEGLGMVSAMSLNQGPAGGFGALDLDVTVNFPATMTGPGTDFPPSGAFLTPGLNTGIDSPLLSGPDSAGFP